MNTTLTLKDSLGNNRREYFTQKKTIREIMKQLDITNQKFIDIETTYTINDDRFGLIFKTSKNGYGHTGRIIIDVIFNEPTWQQMMDVTFGIGYKCDKRIVIYDIAAQSMDKVSNRETAVKFACINNGCNVDTYIINASVSKSSEKDRLKILYKTEAYPGDGYEAEYNNLPTREDFEQAEFWLYFDEYSDVSQERIFDLNWWIGGSVIYYIDNSIEATPSWNNDGFYVHATADNFLTHQSLVKLIETKGSEIEKHFDKYDIKIHRKPDMPIEIIVKLDDRPFREFIFMSIEEKNKYSENYRNILYDFKDYFEELL